MNDELERMRSINLQLRRKLESARREAVEECAKFCEEGFLVPGPRGNAEWEIRQKPDYVNSHAGTIYAAGLRRMIRNEMV